MGHVIGGEGLLGAEVERVLRNQNEAGVRAIVERLRPGVAQAVAEVMCDAFVEIDEQAIELGVPAGIRFEEDEVRARRCELLLAPSLSARVVQITLESVGRLVDVVEAAQVNAVGAEVAEAQDVVFRGLEFER